jgi:carbamoyltransferase
MNKIFYSIIEEFYNLTNIPCLLNTSFNWKWKPIVNNFDDAYKLLINSDLDCIIFEWEYILFK